MGEELAEHFTSFAGTGARRHPVTRRILDGCAGDPAVLDLVAGVPLGRRPSNLLLAAAHDLLLQGVDADLRRWYPTVGGDPTLDADPFPAFRSLVLGHAAAVRALVATRETQTNEVGRCGALRAGLVVATGGRRYDVVDVGTSAGLTLLLDRYRIDYEPGGVVGPEHGDVRIPCRVLAGALPTGSLDLGRRIGLDRLPVRADDEVATRWLLACVWPDDADRASRLQSALAVARTAPPDLVEGDAVDDLERVVPTDVPVVVQHSWMAAYLGEERQRALTDTIDRLARRRSDDAPLAWLFAEQPAECPGLPIPEGDPLPTALVLVTWEGGVRSVRRLADVHPHGAWIRWCDG